MNQFAEKQVFKDNSLQTFQLTDSLYCAKLWK